MQGRPRESTKRAGRKGKKRQTHGVLLLLCSSYHIFKGGHIIRLRRGDAAGEKRRKSRQQQHGAPPAGHGEGQDELLCRGRQGEGDSASQSGGQLPMVCLLGARLSEERRMLRKHARTDHACADSCPMVKARTSQCHMQKARRRSKTQSAFSSLSPSSPLSSHPLSPFSLSRPESIAQRAPWTCACPSRPSPAKCRRWTSARSKSWRRCVSKLRTSSTPKCVARPHRVAPALRPPSAHSTAARRRLPRLPSLASLAPLAPAASSPAVSVCPTLRPTLLRARLASPCACTRGRARV